MRKIAIVIGIVLFMGCDEQAVFSPDSGTGNVSLGGSTARFTIVGDYLYTIDNNSLKTFSISSESVLEQVDELALLWNQLESIFPFGEYIFLGSTSGVLIISIVNPANPVEISQFQHVVSCDPVVAQGDYAYSTLRSGNQCGQALSQLDIIDITSINNPELVASYPLVSPGGLAINGNYLYICDDGVKVFDVSNVFDITQVNYIENIPANDVIFFNNQLLITADDGFYQFNTVDGVNFSPLGHFAY